MSATLPQPHPKRPRAAVGTRLGRVTGRNGGTSNPPPTSSERPRQRARRLRERGSSTRRVHGVAIAAVLLMTVAISACGGSNSTGSQSTTAPANAQDTSTAPPEATGKEVAYDQAVLNTAHMLYASQDIVKAVCMKTGFTPAGDVASCTLASADGSVTSPSSWQILMTRSGTVTFASPMGDSSSSAPPTTGSDGNTGSVGGTGNTGDAGNTGSAGNTGNS
jgi:hypothetical protein